MFKPMPDLRPRPTPVTPEELAARCAKSRLVRETMRLQAENKKLQDKADKADQG